MYQITQRLDERRRLSHHPDKDLRQHLRTPPHPSLPLRPSRLVHNGGLASNVVDFLTERLAERGGRGRHEERQLRIEFSGPSVQVR